MGLPCRQECKYHGFLALVEWCRHPDHLGPIENRRLAIEAAGGKCANHVDWEAKVMPGTEPPWPMPENLQELFPRDYEKPEFVRMAYTIAETSAENDTRAA